MEDQPLQRRTDMRYTKIHIQHKFGLRVGSPNPLTHQIHAAVDVYAVIFSGQCIGFRCCCMLYKVSTGHLSRVFAERLNMHLA